MLRTTLVTGATDGIGKETARVLASRGHFVIIHGRNAERVAGTCAEISAEFPSAQLEGVVGDFSSLDGVRQLAAEVKERFPKLNVLVNNAGVMTQEQTTTADGFELHVGVNHLAPSVLTMALLDVLRANKPSRIVMVSSLAHSVHGTIDRGMKTSAVMTTAAKCKSGFQPFRQYGLSKLGNVMFAQELNRRMRKAGDAYAGVTINSLHPGVIATKMMPRNFHVSGAPAAQGAASSIMLADDAALEGVTGRYFSETKEAEMNPIAKRDADLADMWTWTMATGRIVEKV